MSHSRLPSDGEAAPVRTPSQRLALRIAGTYFLIATLWIFGSGWLLHRLVRQGAAEALLEEAKGWFFVTVTALLLWVVLTRYFRALRASAHQLQENEARYRSLFENMNAGFVLFEVVQDDRNVPVDLTIVAANDRFARITGRTLQEVAGKRLTQVLPGIENDAADWIGKYGRIALGGESRQFEQGSELLGYQYSIVAFPAAPRQCAVSFVDITGRKRAEAALQQRNEELVRFVYTVSHDLKSPLVTISTFLGYLEKDLAAQDGQRIATDMDYMRKAAAKMRDMLEELLELSRVGRLMNAPEDVSLQALAREAQELVAGSIAEGQVQVRVTDAPLMLHGDRQRLLEVFQNLLDNAVKFMGDQPSPLVEIGVEGNEPDLVIFVRDNGQGIDPQHQARVFGLFEKLDPSAPGAGIGLALVKRIVEVHGGRIWVESQGLGHGTTFRFTLSGTKRG
jgi:PAS domain S-box-containing protein